MSRQNLDRISHTIHAWVGLKLSLFMTFILITGTFAVLSLEIDWLLTPEMRSSEFTESSEIAWDETFDALTREYPDYDLIGIFRFSEPWFSLQTLAITPWQENVRLWSNPADGNLQGVTTFYSVQRFFRSMHRNLMMPERTGVPIVTFMAFPLLISLIAGLIVYKKFWLGFFKWPRFEKNTRIWSGDLHRLIGLWTSWFIALIAVSSIWYFIEEFGGNSPPFPGPEFEMIDRNSALPREFAGGDLKLAVDNALKELPGLEVRRILLPRSSRSPLIIQGDLSANLVRPRANGVYIDPSNLEVIGSYVGEELSVHTRISEAADPLHFGYFGGLTTKIIWFILGLSMSAITFTGVVVYTKRLRGENSHQGSARSRPQLS